MTGFLALKGLKILRNGYPIIPIPLGQKFPREKGWQKTEATPGLLGKWLRNGHADSGVGILCGIVSCLDLDIQNGPMAVEMERYADHFLGPAPVRIGNPPKRALIYRVATPLYKIASKWFRDLDGKTNRMEALGDGQQFVSNHIHPETGRPYFWSQNYSPETVPVSELIEITEQQIRDFFAHFERRALELGWTQISGPKAPQTASVRTTSIDDDDDELDLAAEKRKPVDDIDDEHLEKLVMSIPNSQDVPHDVGHDFGQLGWLEMMMAIHHQTDGSEFGRDLAHRWTESGGWSTSD